jgi:flagellar biogenesis protein FliO
MALGDPFQILVVLFLILLIPVVVIYWIVRLAVRHELKKRNPIPT